VVVDLITRSQVITRPDGTVDIRFADNGEDRD